MSARKRSVGARRGGKIKAFGWLQAVVLVVLGGWFVLQPPARREEVSKLVGNYFEKNKRIDLFDVGWDICQLYYSEDFVATGRRADGDNRIYAGPPRADGLGHPVRVLSNQGYVVGYCEALENPVWVAYRIGDVSTLAAPATRPGSFEVDGRTISRVPSQAYTNSGYDRGHLAPNYAIATRYGEEAQRETFLMSNIVPQKHALNAGAWKELEMRIATSYPGRFGEVWVLAGPVFGRHPRKLPNGTVIPEAFYMLVVDESDGRVRVQALLLPQSTPAGANLDDFIVTVDEVEQRTGLDFFPDLEDGVEAALESKRVGRVW